MARKQLGPAPAVSTEAARLGDIGTKTKTTALTAMTGQSLALDDVRPVVNVSDTTQAGSGSLSRITVVEDVASIRALLTNHSVSAQSPFSSDQYLTGSSRPFPSGFPVVGTRYRLLFDVTKTAAGTATPIITVRIGTAGTTSDAAICTFTFGAGTAAADTGIFEVIARFRTVGLGTSAVLQAIARLTSNLTTTGLSNAVKARASTSSGFNSTTAGLIIGASYNGGASASHTVQLVDAELRP